MPGSRDSPTTNGQLGFGLRALGSLIKRAGLAARLGQQFGGKRDLWETLGYAKEPDFRHFWTKYRRYHLAGRIVDMPAQATWRAQPEIRETEKPDELTEFEQAWLDLNDRHRVLHYLERVDRLAGVGRYSVLLIGAPGNLDQPLQAGSVRDVAYLSVFSEADATIATWNTDTSDPRYGRPERYQLDFSSDVTGFPGGGAKRVHWTRVLHVATDVLDSDIFGIPRLERVDTLFEDIAKLVGGSAEMFWQGAERGLHINVDKDFTDFGSDPADIEALDEKIDEYVHGIRRVIQTQGVEINRLGGQVADPSNPADLVLTLIAGTTGIPKRILLGSEQGELASTMDRFTWSERVRERQLHTAEPGMLRPLIDRLMWLGALPTVDRYSVHWPRLESLMPQERAQIATRMAAGAKILDPDRPQRVISIAEYREALGLDPTPPEDDPPGDGEGESAPDDSTSSPQDAPDDGGEEGASM